MSPTIWGPKVWFLLHRLSFYSDRTDVIGAWKAMIVLLNGAIPCKLCRRHMQEYCISNPLIFPKGATGAQVRDTIVMWLYKFHNTVNQRNGTGAFEYDFLRFFYGIGTHANAVEDCRRVLKEIETLWFPLVAKPWSDSVRHLIGLIGGGTFG